MNEEKRIATAGTSAGLAMTGKEQQRTLEVIGAEIRTFTASMLNNVIEIGRRMCEAKGLVPYGQWGSWIRENTGYSVSTADNFMRLFQEYGADQGCLFGAQVDSQTFGKLSYTKALALLAVPKNEREAFAEEVGAESLSTRELKAAIAERDEALRREKAAREELLQADEGHALAMAELQDKLAAAQEQAEKGKEAQEILHSAQDENEELERKLLEARNEIRKLENRPVDVAVQRDEEAIQEAARLAKAKAEAAAAERETALQKQLDTALKKAEKAEKAAEKARKDAESAGAGDREKAAAAEREAAKARQEAEELRKQLKLADPSAAAFKVYFDELQKLWSGLEDVISRAEPELAGKLKQAARALLERFGETVT